MAQIVWTQGARQDLQEVVEYISRDSKAYARSFALHITEKIGRLNAFPESGPLIPEDSEGSLRHVVVGNYRVLYRASASAVFILAILHGARDLGRSP